MEKRKLGYDMEVSAVGLGCMGFSHAYGAPTEEKEAVRLIKQAVEMGYTFFDTAEIYGTQDDPFANERIVGEALKPYRDKVTVATKFGIRFDMSGNKVPYPLMTNSSRERIRESVEGSLKRLQTDHIDLYFQHRIDENTPPEEVAEVMSELIKDGKIRSWGISQANEEYLRRADAVCHVTAVENRYSMMSRQCEKLFGVLEELNVSLVAFSPMANGLLTGKYDKNSTFDSKYDYRSSMPQFTDKSFDENKELFALLSGMTEKKNASLGQISMAWMLCKKPWIIPIPGTRKAERMKENAGAADIKLTSEEVQTLDKALDCMKMSDVFGGSKIVK